MTDRRDISEKMVSQETRLQQVEDFIDSLKGFIMTILGWFGALAALTNGVLWEWNSQDLGELTLHDGIKTNKEFIRTGCGATGAIGTGADAYLADVSGGATEKSYLPVIDLAQTFGPPWGIRLRKGTQDKMFFRVRDDLTGLTTFDAIAYGIMF